MTGKISIWYSKHNFFFLCCWAWSYQLSSHYSVEHRIGAFPFSMTSKGCIGRLFGLAALRCHMAQIYIGQYLQMHAAMLWGKHIGSKNHKLNLFNISVISARQHCDWNGEQLEMFGDQEEHIYLWGKRHVEVSSEISSISYLYIYPNYSNTTNKIKWGANYICFLDFSLEKTTITGLL